MDAQTAARLLCEGSEQWTELVEALHGKRGCGGWTEASYRGLYDGLILACRQAAGAAPPERQRLYRQLEEIVKPWVSLASIERTEAEMLASVLTRSRQVGQALGTWRPRRSVNVWLRSWAAPLLLLWLLVQGALAGWRLWTILETGSRRLDAAVILAALRLDYAAAFTVGVPVLLLAVILLACPRR